MKERNERKAETVKLKNVKEERAKPRVACAVRSIADRALLGLHAHGGSSNSAFLLFTITITTTCPTPDSVSPALALPRIACAAGARAGCFTCARICFERSTLPLQEQEADEPRFSYHAPHMRATPQLAPPPIGCCALTPSPGWPNSPPRRRPRGCWASMQSPCHPPSAPARARPPAARAPLQACR
jgi:hypothetical protein